MAQPPPDDDLEARITRLERAVASLQEEVAVARSDASASRVLAAGADRDVSEVRAELRAHTSALNALRETQLEQGRRLDRVEARLDAVEARLEALEDTVSRGFATMQVGMAHIVTLIEGISGPGRT